MVGSAQSVALANITLNAILCDSLEYFANILEQSNDIENDVRKIVANTYKEHKRIIMNGNNYSKEWHEEAKRRGLPEFSNAVDAISVWLQPETAELFSRFGIFSELECHSRYEIALENYIKITTIEANTLLEMMRKQVIPAVIKAAGNNAAELAKIRSVGIENEELTSYVKKLSNGISDLSLLTNKLEKDIHELSAECVLEKTIYMRDVIRVDMLNIRECCDLVEQIVDEKDWPMPTYTDLMHRV